MIIIKTKMNNIPSSCSKCGYYSAEGIKTFCRVCLARGKDKLIDFDIKPYLERDKNCPLEDE